MGRTGEMLIEINEGSIGKAYNHKDNNLEIKIPVTDNTAEIQPTMPTIKPIKQESSFYWAMTIFALVTFVLIAIFC